MSYQATVYHVLVASPSDVQEERRIVPQVIYEWNAQHSLDHKVVLLPVMWETHSYPEMGDRPQGILNEQLIDYLDCDFLIGTFWTRIGTSTGEAESGTVEEIEQFRSKGKPVMLYFSRTPIDPNRIDLGQYQKLKEYKDRCKKESIYGEFSSADDLAQKISNHLSRLVGTIAPSSRTRKRVSSQYSGGRSLGLAP